MVIKQTRYSVEICRDVTTSGDKTGDTILGAIIGGAIGNNVGDVENGGALGAVIGGIGGLFCDVRVKEDIAPLCKSEVNDLLSECAFFVKDLNECS